MNSRGNIASFGPQGEARLHEVCPMFSHQVLAKAPLDPLLLGPSPGCQLGKAWAIMGRKHGILTLPSVLVPCMYQNNMIT